MEKAYSFKKKNSTNEIHIFEGKFTIDSCNANSESICKKTKLNEGNWLEGSTCLNEQQAREKAAKIGKSVCGICVSHLYTTY